MKRELKDDSNLPPQADRGNQAHMAYQHAPQLLPEAVQFDVQEA
jgi:hypothetical protein